MILLIPYPNPNLKSSFIDGRYFAQGCWLSHCHSLCSQFYTFLVAPQQLDENTMQMTLKIILVIPN